MSYIRFNCSLIVFIVIFVFLQSQQVKFTDKCDTRIAGIIGLCRPDAGNLLIGRSHKLYASSTCGLQQPERYCIVSNVKSTARVSKSESCSYCYSDRNFSRLGKSVGINNFRNYKEHNIQNIISDNSLENSRRNSLTWWQSRNGVENVYIQLDLETEFHFTHLDIYFRTFRPKAMLIERSLDQGKSWKVYKYFAYNCKEMFPNIPHRRRMFLSDVVCDESYSKIDPSSFGNVIFRAIPLHLKPSDPYAPEVLDLLRFTNLRINFTGLHTLGDDFLNSGPSIKEKYFYAISRMVVFGRCSCYGHAPYCVPMESSGQSGQARAVDAPPPLINMVSGRCYCIHNTTSTDCSECLPFHHDQPWRPAYSNVTNSCKRCNCNNHADECRFDEIRYRATGYRSGGVCINCTHNTAGPNCERCISGYYRVPGLSLSNPKICQKCECNPIGSVGDCLSQDDINIALLSGHCFCKKNVQGKLCDICSNGFWNMSIANRHGCQKCSCSVEGSRSVHACDPVTGQCPCRSNVTGVSCDRCMRGYWGLGSGSFDGCRPCECDPGGAYNNLCDSRNGQCSCRKHLIGRKCSRVQEYYYSGLPDYLLFESEDMNSSNGTRVIVRDGLPVSWTGVGYMSVFNNAQLYFTVQTLSNIVMNYSIIIRHATLKPIPSKPILFNVLIVVETLDNDRHISSCKSSNPMSVVINIRAGDSFSLSEDVSICMVDHVEYRISVNFSSLNFLLSDHNPYLQIDSIVFIPNIPEIPFDFIDSRQFPSYVNIDTTDCIRHFHTAKTDLNSLSHECRSYAISLGYYAFNGAEYKSCGCNSTGSKSALCNSHGGQCDCKQYITGRICSKCAPGFYNFNYQGCIACDCDPTGSFSPICHNITGRCECRDNIGKSQCNECIQGYWDFPNCKPCLCNNRATECDKRTGVCLNCTGHTTGSFCHECESGYYSEHINDVVNMVCLPCMCPGLAANEQLFAYTCDKNMTLDTFVCDCFVGYKEPRCSTCNDNYFGKPANRGGSCQPCNCSGNIDMSASGNCDTETGVCLRCLFNTTGSHCENCAPGFYGNALNRSCTECKCDRKGTSVAASGTCDSVTGLCNCLPHVTGDRCNVCEPNYWNMQPVIGCAPCNCSHVGSLSRQCDAISGECSCIDGFGGRMCDECRQNFWGKALSKNCKPCMCNKEGSFSEQCDKETGVCDCLPGINGIRCDMCARGFFGDVPQCQACGECFDNWDRTLSELQVQSEGLIKQATEMKHYGLSGVYKRQFDQIEHYLHTIKGKFLNITVSHHTVNKLQSEITVLRRNISRTEQLLSRIGIRVDNSSQRVMRAQVGVAGIRIKADELDRDAKLLKQNATSLQEADVNGALKLTQLAYNRSQEIRAEMFETEKLLAEVLRNRKRTENLLNRIGDDFNRTQIEDERIINDATRRLDEIQQMFPQLNALVCDGAGDPCDAVCGGAGCDGVCGGVACSKGALTRSSNALSTAQNAYDLVQDRHKHLNHLYNEILNSKSTAESIYHSTVRVFNEAKFNYDRTEQTRFNLVSLIDNVEQLMSGGGVTVESIYELANETLSKKLSLNANEILDMAIHINSSINNLTNIDSVLSETSNYLQTTNQLKLRAQNAKDGVERLLELLMKIDGVIKETTINNQQTNQTLIELTDMVANTNKHIQNILFETNNVELYINKTWSRVEKLSKHQLDMFRTYTRLELNVKQTIEETKLAEELADKIEKNIVIVEDKYRSAITSLNSKKNGESSIRERASDLLTKTNKLVAQTESQINDLNQITDEFMSHEEILLDLSDELTSLNERAEKYLEEITQKAQFYRTCQS